MGLECDVQQGVKAWYMYILIARHEMLAPLFSILEVTDQDLLCRSGKSEKSSYLPTSEPVTQSIKARESEWQPDQWAASIFLL